MPGAESGQLPPGHPAVDLQAGPQAGGAQMPADPSKLVSGIIQVSPKVKSHVQKNDVLFLAVRQDQGGLPGPILAVDRLEVSDFPMPFAIDGSKAMVPGTAFAGKVIVTARVDKDKDAMTKNPGDVEGKATTTIPAKHLVVTLDTVLP
jgi:hypothetical protein